MERPAHDARHPGDAVRVGPGAAAAPNDHLASVGRALDVLEAVAAAPDPLPAKAIAHDLGIGLGTTYHVLNTLEHAGYVVRLTRGRFGLGPKVPELYRLFHRRHDLVPAVRPLLDELAERAEEDAYMAVFRDGEVVVAEVVGASPRLHVTGLEVGFTRIAHTTAIGKVLLASATDADLDDYLQERRLVPYTHRTLRAAPPHQAPPAGRARAGHRQGPGGARRRVLLRGRAGARRTGRGGRRDRHLDARRAVAHP